MLKITVYPKSGGKYTRTFYSVASAKEFVDDLVVASSEAAQQGVHGGLCENCGEPLAAAALHEHCFPPATISN